MESSLPSVLVTFPFAVTKYLSKANQEEGFVFGSRLHGGQEYEGPVMSHVLSDRTPGAQFLLPFLTIPEPQLQHGAAHTPGRSSHLRSPLLENPSHTPVRSLFLQEYWVLPSSQDSAPQCPFLCQGGQRKGTLTQLCGRWEKKEVAPVAGGTNGFPTPTATQRKEPEAPTEPRQEQSSEHARDGQLLTVFVISARLSLPNHGGQIRA